MLIIDLSNANTVTANGFALMRAAGIMGAFLKVSEGATYDDAQFRLREQVAERSQLHVGGYHYARPDRNTPREEAEHFLRRYPPVSNDQRALKAVLDMEAPQAAKLRRRLITWSREWNAIVHQALGHWPLFYSYPAYIADTMAMTSADKPIGGGLWLASYGRNDGREHPYLVPPPWRRAVAHQFTSAALVPGVAGHVDLSSFTRLAPLLAHAAPLPHGV